MAKNFILQIDLCRIDPNRVIEKTRSNGQPARFYNMVLTIDEEENEKGNIGIACEKLLKCEYDAGEQGRKVGYIQKTRRP